MPSTRRAVLSGAAGACTLALAGCSTPGSESGSLPADAWTQFGFDAANAAATDARGPDDPDSSPAWVHLAGTYYRTSTQVLVGERVHANAGYAGLYALAPADGTIDWHDPEGYKALTPALAGGVVVPGGYGFRRVARDGGLAVAGRRFGYRDWQTNLASYPESPATVADGVLVAGVGSPQRPPGGRVVAVDRADGTVRWSTSVESTVWGTPAVRDGVVYAAQRATARPDVTAALYAFDLADGERLWRRELGTDPRFDPVDAPVAGDGLVYASTGTGPLVAHDAATGARVWTFDPPGGVQGSPALADGRLHVGDLDGGFHAIEATTGERAWHRTVDGSSFHGGPAVAADGVYAATFDGTLASWRLDGTERWRVRLDPPITATPVVAGGRLYLGTTEGLLYALA